MAINRASHGINKAHTIECSLEESWSEPVLGRARRQPEYDDAVLRVSKRSILGLAGTVQDSALQRGNQQQVTTSTETHQGKHIQVSPRRHPCNGYGTNEAPLGLGLGLECMLYRVPRLSADGWTDGRRSLLLLGRRHAGRSAHASRVQCKPCASPWREIIAWTGGLVTCNLQPVTGTER
jgi:hypothetical protein